MTTTKTGTPVKRRKRKGPAPKTQAPPNLAAKIAAAAEIDEALPEVVPESKVPLLKTGPLGNHDFIEHGSVEHAVVVLQLDPDTGELMFDAQELKPELLEKLKAAKAAQLAAGAPPIPPGAPPMWKPGADKYVTEVN